MSSTEKTYEGKHRPVKVAAAEKVKETAKALERKIYRAF